MSEVQPTLRIRANATENVKGLVSCEVTVETIHNLDVGVIKKIEMPERFVVDTIEQTLSKMHKVLREKGHRLAVDGGA